MSKKPCEMETRCNIAIDELIALRNKSREHKNKNYGAMELFYQNWIDKRSNNEPVDLLTFMRDHKFYHDQHGVLCCRSLGDETILTGEIYWIWGVLHRKWLYRGWNDGGF